MKTQNPYFSTSLLVYLPYMVYKHAENCKLHPCVQVRSRKTSCAVIPHLTTLMPPACVHIIRGLSSSQCVFILQLSESVLVTSPHTPRSLQLRHVCFHCHWNSSPFLTLVGFVYAGVCVSHSNSSL